MYPTWKTLVTDLAKSKKDQLKRVSHTNQTLQRNFQENHRLQVRNPISTF